MKIPSEPGGGSRCPPVTMRTRTSLALVLVAVPLHAQTVSAPVPGPTVQALRVHIDAPTAGVLDADLVVPFEATVNDPEVRSALLTVNGASYEVPVRAGRVRQQVVVVPGNNRVALTVTRGAEAVTDATTFHLRGERAEMVIVLSWPTEGEIIDLWVREPDGQTCKWDRRRTSNGGRLLDFSADAIGFGSQAYVTPRVDAGRYRVKVHYWSARGRDDERGAWTWQQAADALEDTERRLLGATGDARHALLDTQRTLEARLDRWASPGAPQTRVRAEVVLFPNTPSERRWRFDRNVDRSGQLLTLGEVVVDDAVIAAARRAAEGAVR